MKHFIFCAICSLLAMSSLLAQPKIERAWLVGFDQYGHQSGYGNALIRFSHDTVRVDSIDYILPTCGVGEAMLLEDHGVVAVHNGYITKMLPHLSNSGGFTVGAPYSGPYGFQMDSIGRPLPQSSILYERGLVNSPSPYFVSIESQINDFVPLFELHPSGGSELVFELGTSGSTWGIGEYYNEQFQPYKTNSATYNEVTRSALVKAGYTRNRLLVAAGLLYKNTFLAGFKITKPGVNTTPAVIIQQVFTPTDTTPVCQNHGATLFSPKGDKYAVWGDCKIQLMDYNRCTGQLSNYKEVLPPIERLVRGGGLAFSPSGRYLYVSDYRRLYRIDVEADTLAFQLVRDSWGAWNNPMVIAGGAALSYMYLAPDGKIYIVPPYRAKYIHVLSNLEEDKPLDVTFGREGLKLPVFNLQTIPAYFNTDLGFLPGGGGPCDTISVSAYEQENMLHKSIFSLHPNPASSQTFVNLEATSSFDLSGFVIELANITGQLITTFKPVANVNAQLIETSHLPSGVYFVSLRNKSQVLHTEKLVILQP
jgi:Secretion system C-terminal sorting domain